MNLRQSIISVLLFILLAIPNLLSAQSIESKQWEQDSISVITLSNTDLLGLTAFTKSISTSSESILLKSSQLFYLFENEILIKKVLPNEEFFIAKDDESLEALSVLGSENKQRLIIHYVSRPPSWFGKHIDNMVESNSYLSESKNHILLLFLISIFLIVILRINFSNRFYEIYNFNRSLSLRPLEGDSNRLRLFDQSGIFAAIIYLFIFSIVTSVYFWTSHKIDFVVGDATLPKQFFVSLLIAAVLLFLKVLVIYLASYIFKVKKINTFYVKELINLNVLFVSLLFVPVVLVYLFDGLFPSYFHDILGTIFLFIYLFRGFLLYFKILKLSGFTNVYLFSYFCTTELFPLIIGLKFFY